MVVHICHGQDWSTPEYNRNVYIVACQEGGVSSETAIQGANKTILPFSPL